jgi:hypothetical protein
MRDFLNRIRLAKLFWRFFPVVSMPPGYWSDADAKSLSNWLGTDSGVKYRHLRWNAVYQSQLQAITNRSDSAYAAGTAFGMRSMVAFEDSLLQIELPQPQIQEQDAAFRSVNR